MNVFELFATLGLDSSSYEEGLNNAETKGSDFSSKLGSVLATGSKIAVGALAATTAATVAGTTAFVNGVAGVAEYGDAIDKTSQKLGLSYESYQKFDYVLNIAGTSMQNVTMGMKTLTNKMDDAKNGSADAAAQFEALGISLEDLETMSREELFEAAIYGFSNMEESAERAALANDLFGRSGQELAPLFNMEQSQIEELMDTASEYGMIMSDDAVQASAAFKDSLTTLKGTMNGLKNTMLSEFLPGFTTVMDGLAAVFAGDEGGLGMIDEGINDFIIKLNEIAPQAMEIGANILMSLVSSITKNLPVVLSQGSTIISQLLQGIISALPSLLQSAMMIIGQVGSAILENAPLLLTTALELVIMLANGITQNAPTVIPAIVTVVKEMVTALTEPSTLSLLIQAALQLILALAEGLVLAIPDLVSIIPIYYANIIQTIIAIFPDLLNAVLVLLGDLGAAVFGVIGGLMGMNYDQIAAALANAGALIQNAFSNIVGWFSSLASSITSTVSNLWTNVVSFFSNGLTTAYNTVNSVLTTISSTFTSIFEGVKSTVENAINFIKGLFDFEWSLPDLKLPHFSVTGSLDLLVSPPKVPSLSVSWYAKAMEQPYLLNGATIFGSAGGRLLGGGEAGSEMVIGTDKLMGMMREAVGVGANPITINIYGAAGQDVRELAKEVSKEIQNLITDKEKAYA
jgi:hypothetical protein